MLALGYSGEYELIKAMIAAIDTPFYNPDCYSEAWSLALLLQLHLQSRLSFKSMDIGNVATVA